MGAFLKGEYKGAQRLPLGGGREEGKAGGTAQLLSWCCGTCVTEAAVGTYHLWAANDDVFCLWVPLN